MADRPIRPSISRRSFVAAGASAALLAALPCHARAAAPADEVVLFHTNDTHGYLHGDGESVVGIDRVAALKASVPGALLVDAGDATQGLPLASLTKGAEVVELMGLAGYDAMALGNHEFDFGADALLANARAAGFPMLGANVLDARTGRPLLEGASGDGCSAVLESGGRRIGVFGLATTATAWSVAPACVEGIEFIDEVPAAEAQIAALGAQGVDAVVCLAHLGDGDVPCRGADLAARLSPEAASMLAAIVDGHSHTVENEEVNGVLVVQTGGNGAAVGKLTLSFSPDGRVGASEELLDAAAVAALVEPDPAVAAALEEAESSQAGLLEEPVGESTTTLWGGWIGASDISAPARMVETNLGDLVCDAYLEAAGAFMAERGDGAPVVAVVNGGALRAALPCGQVTRGDLVTAFPFSNTVMVKLVTGPQLREMLEASLRLCAGQDALTGMLLQEHVSGDFLQVGGMTVVADPCAQEGGRVVSAVLDGEGGPLDLEDSERQVALVSNSYVMTGGGHAPLGEVELLAEVGGDLETIEAHVRRLAEEGEGALPALGGTRGSLAFRCDGYVPGPWTAHVRVLGADGEPAAGEAVMLCVDGEAEVEADADAEGLVSFEVEDGPHGVALVGADGRSSEEAYVNNYTGHGLVEDDLRPWPELRRA